MKILAILLISHLFPLLAYAACETDSHREFDFWLGQWNVTLADGKVAGTNHISKQQNGCLLREEWTSQQAGFTGTSLNFYHPQKKQWQQLWIDNSGSVLELSGGLQGTSMILKSDTLQKDDKSFYHQISWTPRQDGSVRQHWQTFVEGAEPTTVFDGVYKRKPD